MIAGGVKKSRMQLQRLLVILGVLLVLSLLACCQSTGKVTFQDSTTEHEADKQGKQGILVFETISIKRHGYVLCNCAKCTRDSRKIDRIYK